MAEPVRKYNKYNEFSLPVPDDPSPKIYDLISNGKETLKNLKVYVPTDEYNSAMTFEQNLAEGKIKLMSELPVSDFSPKNDPINEYMTSSKMHQDFNQYIKNNNVKQEMSDFDALVNPNLKSKQQPSSTNSWDPDNLSDTSQDGEKLHSCDVCLKKFNRRRDLALHYLTHSEREKKRVTKKRKVGKKCDVCMKISRYCKCKEVDVTVNKPNSMIEPDCISLDRPLSANTVFIKAESVSGKSDVIKRELFHCAECPQVFGLISQLKQHRLSHKRKKASDEKCLICSFCNKKCISKSELLYHKSTVHQNEASAVSKPIYPLDTENLSYIELQAQVCSNCHTVFNDMNGLQKHFKRLGWVCGICSCYFCLKNDFSAHCLTHLDSVSYIEDTDKPSTSECLSDKATGKDDLSCKKCSKKFKFVWMLNQHKLKHTLRKNKFCLKCKKCFKQKKNACIHFFSHKNRMKFECGECNKTFYEEKCLKVHMIRIH